jgi:pSer/pThr/pTyr-binding forkhead associated (FHA) protein
VTRPGGERRGHARIFIDPKTGTYQIEDLGSTSGTKVNGKRLNKGSSLALVSGDTITVGNILMKYYDQRPLMETQF